MEASPPDHLALRRPADDHSAIGYAAGGFHWDGTNAARIYGHFIAKWGGVEIAVNWAEVLQTRTAARERIAAVMGRGLAGQMDGRNKKSGEG